MVVINIDWIKLKKEKKKFAQANDDRRFFIQIQLQKRILQTYFFILDLSGIEKEIHLNTNDT